MKHQYEKDKNYEQTHKFANSSYLTPESIGYLNDIIKANGGANKRNEVKGKGGKMFNREVRVD